MLITVNQKVSTPYGTGIVQGFFEVRDQKTQATISTGIAVRLPVNETTQPHLNDANCVTASAKHSGVWVFQEGELA